jgi:hypothetical protein
MSEPSYTLTITEAERTALARSLGILVTKLINLPVNAPPTIDAGGFDRCKKCGAGFKMEPGGVRCLSCGEFYEAWRDADDPKSGTQAARAVLSPGPRLNQPSPRSGGETAAPPAVARTSTPIEVRDRWARDRKGKEVPNPKGSYAVAVRIWKAERRDLPDFPRLKVTWQNQEKGYTDAACWDENLFPFLAVASKNPQPTTIYLTQKDAYLNVVGVRA